MADSHRYACGACSKCFAAEDTRDRHCAGYGHIVPPYECSTCCRPFKTEPALLKHERDANHCPYSCEECGRTWPTFAELQTHAARNHSWWLCHGCESGFESEGELNDHVADEHGYICDECEEEHPTLRTLKRHERNKHWYACDYCDADFVTLLELRNHETSHGVYACDECPYVFASPRALAMHERHEHAWRKCEECGTDHLTPLQLQAHTKGHRFECEWCPAVVRSRSELSQHEVLVHNAHYCHKCEELCYSAHDLLRHQASHGDWHRCGLCDVKAGNEQFILEHERADHFICHECRLVCASRVEIERHLRTSSAHVGRPMPCPFCRGGFRTASRLVYHLEQGVCPSAPALGIRELCEVIKRRELTGYLKSALAVRNSVSFRKRWTTQKHAYCETFRFWRIVGVWRCSLCTIYGVTGQQRDFPSREALVRHLHSSARKFAACQ